MCGTCFFIGLCIWIIPYCFHNVNYILHFVFLTVLFELKVVPGASFVIVHGGVLKGTLWTSLFHEWFLVVMLYCVTSSLSSKKKKHIHICRCAMSSKLLLLTGASSCPATPDKKHRASARCRKLDKNSLTSGLNVCFCPVIPAPWTVTINSISSLSSL